MGKQEISTKAKRGFRDQENMICIHHFKIIHSNQE